MASPIEPDEPLYWFTGPVQDGRLLAHCFLNLVALVFDRFYPSRSSNGPIYIDRDVPWQYIDRVTVGPPGERPREWWAREHYGYIPAGFEHGGFNDAA